MKLIDKILITEIYHLTTGAEQEFLKIWKAEIYRVASGLGGRVVSLYHKKDTNDYLVTSHWPDLRLAEKYLKSDELKRANIVLSKVCSAPYENQIFEILSEAAA